MEGTKGEHRRGGHRWNRLGTDWGRNGLSPRSRRDLHWRQRRGLLVESASGKDEHYNSRGKRVEQRGSEHRETEVVFGQSPSTLSAYIQCPINDCYMGIYRRRFTSHVYSILNPYNGIIFREYF